MLLNLRGSGPLYRRVYQSLKSEIGAGRLAPGARRPSTRAMAADLGISRNTVVLAYEQLQAEGYIISRTRSKPSVGAIAVRTSPASSRTKSESPPRLSRYGQRL